MPRRKSEQPKPETDSVSTRLTLAEIAAMEELARADDRTMSYLIAKAVREFIERHRPPQQQPPATRKVR